MKILRTFASLAAVRERHYKKLPDRSIGFVPTMGALHEGHLSLVRKARKENDEVWVSIFVNPLQFGPAEDFRRYPRNLKRDALLLRKEGVSVLYAPDESTFYAPGFQTHVNVGGLSKGLCGQNRPHHFGGVATVVTKLLCQVRPASLYLGQKDFQQCRVIERLVEDLSLPVLVRRCAIVREPDGLAMSSRNAYLNSDERLQAVALHQALIQAEEAIKSGQKNTSAIKRVIGRVLGQASLGWVEYAEIVDAATLKPVITLKPRMEVLVALAVKFTHARLIDNKLIFIR